ncbi:DUF4064 domain-containing protein [[Mycoplasma] testudinis]|uniref:DUF4064 domain-containing protein n=1 Tax=[Mycoplasma] testudinis TaxID=33924 RepID=UPI0004879074|nr:DUF4064 domain-containing protein [[Mycoplasma] testudinis]
MFKKRSWSIKQTAIINIISFLLFLVFLITFAVLISNYFTNNQDSANNTSIQMYSFSVYLNSFIVYLIFAIVFIFVTAITNRKISKFCSENYDAFTSNYKFAEKWPKIVSAFKLFNNQDSIILKIMKWYLLPGILLGSFFAKCLILSPSLLVALSKNKDINENSSKINSNKSTAPTTNRFKIPTDLTKIPAIPAPTVNPTISPASPSLSKIPSEELSSNLTSQPTKIANPPQTTPAVPVIQKNLNNNPDVIQKPLQPPVIKPHTESQPNLMNNQNINPANGPLFSNFEDITDLASKAIQSMQHVQTSPFDENLFQAYRANVNFLVTYLAGQIDEYSSLIAPYYSKYGNMSYLLTEKEYVMIKRLFFGVYCIVPTRTLSASTASGGFSFSNLFSTTVGKTVPSINFSPEYFINNFVTSRTTDLNTGVGVTFNPLENVYQNASVPFELIKDKIYIFNYQTGENDYFYNADTEIETRENLGYSIRRFYPGKKEYFDFGPGAVLSDIYNRPDWIRKMVLGFYMFYETFLCLPYLFAHSPEHVEKYWKLFLLNSKVLYLMKVISNRLLDDNTPSKATEIYFVERESELVDDKQTTTDLNTLHHKGILQKGYYKTTKNVSYKKAYAYKIDKFSLKDTPAMLTLEPLFEIINASYTVLENILKERIRIKEEAEKQLAAEKIKEDFGV